jgi:hypothetical protein
MSRRLATAAALFALVVGALAPSARSDVLIGVEGNTGKLYRISSTDASLTYLSDTGIDRLDALERGPDGFLYGFGEPLPNRLYRIDPRTFAPTLVGSLSHGAFEGSIAFAPDGTAYATNGDNAFEPELMRIDLPSGATTVVGRMAPQADVNGLAWRSDGQLVGIDRVTNSLVRINPATAALSVVAPLQPVLGAVGGMAVLDGTACFTTAGPGAGIPGSNELWKVDPFTGAHQRIGSFAPTLSGWGIAGMATVVPEPGPVMAAGMAAMALGFGRRRRGGRRRGKPPANEPRRGETP